MRRHKVLAAAMVCAFLLVVVTGLLVSNHLEGIERENEALYKSLVLRGVVQLELAKQSESDLALSDGRMDVSAWAHLAEGAIEELEKAARLFPKRPEANYHLASALHLLGQNSDAEKVLERSDQEFFPAVLLKTELRGEGRERAAGITETQADWEEAWYAAHQALKDRDWTNAAEAYGKLIDRYPEDPESFLGMAIEARLGRGRAHLEDKEYHYALLDFAVAAGLWPDFMEPSLLMGETYLLMVEPERAKERFRRLYQRTRLPDRDKVALGITYVYRNRNHQKHPRWKEALEWARKIDDPAVRERKVASFLCELEQFDEALEAAETSRALDPDAPDVYIVLGSVFRKQRKFGEAIEQFDKALKLIGDSRDAPGYERRLAEGYEHRADAYFKMGEFDQAIADYTRAIHLGRNTMWIYDWLAAAYWRVGKLDEAIDSYTEAIRLFPKEPQLHIARARLYNRAGKFDEAIDDLTETIQLDPTSASSYHTRAAIYLATREFDKAIDDLTDSIRLDQGVHASNYQNRGYAYKRVEEFEKALADYTDAIRLNPNVGLLHLRRGETYTAIGEFELAIDDFDIAIDLEPEEWYYRGRGIAYMGMGDLPNATRDFTEQVRRHSWDASNRYFLALARLDADKIGAYRATCREILDRNGRTKKSEIARWVAWTCVLLPDATADLSCVVNLADRAVVGDPDSNFGLRALGAALYRAGRFEEAVERLTEADQLVGKPVSPLSPGPVYSWLFLAMAHHRLRHRNEAEEWFDKAMRWTNDEIPELDQDGRVFWSVWWATRATVRLLRDEARALLELPAVRGQPEIIPQGDGKQVHREEE